MGQWQTPSMSMLLGHRTTTQCSCVLACGSKTLTLTLVGWQLFYSFQRCWPADILPIGSSHADVAEVVVERG